MSVDLDIPNPWGINLNASGGLDLDLDNIHVSVEKIPKIVLETDSDVELNAKLDVDVVTKSDLVTNSQLKAELDTKSVVALDSDSKLDLGLDNIRIQQLPELKFEFAIRPMRFSLPLNFKWRLCLFGVELINFETCGEGMFIAENLEKHKSESCA